jgi:hypothetical protein
VYKRTVPRPRLRTTDRLFWVWLARVWAAWRQPLLIVTPDTVLRWQRRRFREHWTTRSGRPRVGRSPINAEIAALIRRMAAMNPLWGAPRIHGELMKFGIEVAERTVSRLIPRRRSPPSQTWRTFLANHGPNLVSLEPIDWRQQAIIFWGGGLRGALPLVLALSLPFDFAERQRILDLTAGVVLFTLLVQGTTVSRLIRSLGPTSGGNPSHTGSVARS